MAYIPKNRIQTNLYTPGGEYYIDGVNPNYVGYYHKTYTGGTFSGKNPDDTPVYPLIRITEYGEIPSGLSSKVYITNDLASYEYGILKGVDMGITRDIPQLKYTTPTQDDYKLGEFRRYFCKRGNEFTYLEISKKDYDRLLKKDPTIDFKPWIPFNIPWSITGDPKVVASTNSNIVMLKEKQEKFYGFSKFLQQDYLRYYKS